MKAYTLKVTLLDSTPIIWRSVTIPAEITFQRLHEVIQCLMLWQDYHQYEFVTPDDKYRFVGDQETVDEFNARCADMDEKPQWQYKLASKTKIDSLLNKHRQLDYVYDFGDYWNIKIEMEEIREKYEKPFATCMDGENPSPPEDVGGLDGYQIFLDAVDNPNHEQHDYMREWSEGWSRKFNKRIINTTLREVILKRIPVPPGRQNGRDKKTKSDNIIDILTPQNKWLGLPDSVMEKILLNGFCVNCKGTAEIVDYKVSSSHSTVYIEGKCKKCGGKIVRCLD